MYSMQKDCIEISGITPHDHFPKCPRNHPCGQICETDQLCVPKQKPNIKCILQVLANISISSFKTICTPLGKKLVIDGVKHIKILYVADEPCQNVHSAHFDVPFCMFILLNDKNYEIVDVFTGIEYISIHQLSHRCFSISIIIFACPIFKKKDDPCHPHSKEYINCHPHINCHFHLDCNHDTCLNYDCYNCEHGSRKSSCGNHDHNQKE